MYGRRVRFQCTIRFRVVLLIRHQCLFVSYGYDKYISVLHNLEEDASARILFSSTIAIATGVLAYLQTQTLFFWRSFIRLFTLFCPI